MSKILVVQPHRMLQQAMALFLSPAHEVQITEAVPESLPANDFDAVIVDAASLQETKGLAAQTMRAVQDWKVPTIWIESGESSETPKRDKFVLMNRPIAREVLEASLAECLGMSTASKRNGAVAEKKIITSAATQDSKVIELVDVIEEDPGQKTTQQKKK